MKNHTISLKMNQKKYALRSFILLLIFSVNSFAFGPAAPLPGGPVPPPSGNRYSEGYQLGNRNGTLLSGRLYDRTIKLKGCSQLNVYQNALLNVNRSIKAPNLNADTDVELVRGFFKGYLDAVRTAIETSRKGCKKIKFESGVFAGQFYGSLFCQASTVNADLLSSLEVVPLYSGWSGGLMKTVKECVSSGTFELRSCGYNQNGAPLPSSLNANLLTACKL